MDGAASLRGAESRASFLHLLHQSAIISPIPVLLSSNARGSSQFSFNYFLQKENLERLGSPIRHACALTLCSIMSVGHSAVGSSSSYRNSKLALTPLIIPPPLAPSSTETAVDGSTPALSLETPGRPGSARLAPLRNPPLAPPVVDNHAVNLPDVVRAPFVPQRISAIDSSGSDSDDQLAFAIDLKPADRLSHTVESQPPSSQSFNDIGPSSPGIISAVLLAPIGHVSAFTSPSQPCAPDAHLPTIRPPAPSPATSALDSGLSLRERQLLQLLSADEQGHLHSHALGSAPSVNSSFRASSSNVSKSDGSGASSPKPSQNFNVQLGIDDKGTSTSVSHSAYVINSSASASGMSLSRKGSDAHSDGSWDDDDVASGL